jgi:hypothetical protein
VINLSRRSFVTTGTRDLLALAVGLSGFAVIGPIELLTSTAVVISLGPTYWALVLALYTSGWLLIAMHLKPRLVIYNIAQEELSVALEQAARRLDPDAHWTGHTLLSPAWQAQLALEPFSVLCNVSIVSVGEPAAPLFWRQLESALRQQLAESRVPPSSYGLGMVIVAVAMLIAMAYQWVSDAQAITRGLMDMLGVG